MADPAASRIPKPLDIESQSPSKAEAMLIWMIPKKKKQKEDTQPSETGPPCSDGNAQSTRPQASAQKVRKSDTPTLTVLQSITKHQSDVKVRGGGRDWTKHVRTHRQPAIRPNLNRRRLTTTDPRNPHPRETGFHLSTHNVDVFSNSPGPV